MKIDVKEIWPIFMAIKTFKAFVEVHRKEDPKLDKYYAPFVVYESALRNFEWMCDEDERRKRDETEAINELHAASATLRAISGATVGAMHPDPSVRAALKIADARFFAACEEYARVFGPKS